MQGLQSTVANRASLTALFMHMLHVMSKWAHGIPQSLACGGHGGVPGLAFQAQERDGLGFWQAEEGVGYPKASNITRMDCFVC